MVKRCALSTGNLLQGGLPRKSVDRITDRPGMTSAVNRGRKASTQTKQTKTFRKQLQKSLEKFKKKNNALFSVLLREDRFDRLTAFRVIYSEIGPATISEIVNMVPFDTQIQVCEVD